MLNPELDDSDEGYVCDMAVWSSSVCISVIFAQIPASPVEMPASMNSAAQLDVQFGYWDEVPAAVSASTEFGSGINFTADIATPQSHCGASTHRYWLLSEGSQQPCYRSWFMVQMLFRLYVYSVFYMASVHRKQKVNRFHWLNND